MSFTAREMAARTHFSDARCNLQPRKLPCALSFRMLSVIYEPKNGRAQSFFGRLVSLYGSEITITPLSNSNWDLRPGKLLRALVFRILDDPKVAVFFIKIISKSA